MLNWNWGKSLEIGTIDINFWVLRDYLATPGFDINWANNISIEIRCGAAFLSIWWYPKGKDA
jgi:hypothetical protein